MSDVVFSPLVAARRRGIRVMLFLGLLAFCVSAAATKVDRCKQIGGAFNTGFSEDFFVSHKVCGSESLGLVAVDDLRNIAFRIVRLIRTVI